MPKLLCKCGEVLSYGAIPCPIEWKLLADVKFDKFSGQVDAKSVYRASDTMLRCPNCDRLWVFWDEATIPTEYVRQPAKRHDN